MSKQKRIEAFIKKYGFITKKIAASVFSEYNLGEKIRRAKEKGMRIETIMTPQIEGSDFAIYKLIV